MSDSRWLALWQRLGASGDADRVYQDLLARYSEPGRAYHNLTHIEACLAELASVFEPEADREAIEFAIWFHDAIYDTKAKDSEERSAALAGQTVEAAGLSAAFGALVTSLIVATKHTTVPVTLNEQLLVDIDLSILGKPPQEFDEYERQIRVEYSWVPAQAFAQGRTAVLSTIMSRPRIYSTAPFQARYEAIARENLARSLGRLA